MSHAQGPDFSTQPIATGASPRTQAPEPVLAAIDAHAEAWAVRAAADGGWQFEVAEIQLCAALSDLLAAPCRSHAGAHALIRHLRWLIREDGITAESDGWFDQFILAREADLSRFVGSDLPPAVIPTGLPKGHLPPPRRALTPPRITRPMRHVAELLAAVAIIGGGAVLTGLATLL